MFNSVPTGISATPFTITSIILGDEIVEGSTTSWTPIIAVSTVCALTSKLYSSSLLWGGINFGLSLLYSGTVIDQVLPVFVTLIPSVLVPLTKPFSSYNPPL